MDLFVIVLWQLPNSPKGRAGPDYDKQLCRCVHLLLTNRFLVRMGELIFDDIFKVQRVNPDGKKYDKGMLLESWCSTACSPNYMQLLVLGYLCFLLLLNMISIYFILKYLKSCNTH